VRRIGRRRFLEGAATAAFGAPWLAAAWGCGPGGAATGPDGSALGSDLDAAPDGTGAGPSDGADGVPDVWPDAAPDAVAVQADVPAELALEDLATPADAIAVDAAAALAETRHATLVGLLDALVPGGEASPGATIAGAVDYVDGLVAAFDAPVPRIFAGGPYSGTHGGLDGFSSFVPLTRVEAIAWRMRVEGSAGKPEREFNGAYMGAVERYAAGLDALEAAAWSNHAKPFASLDLDARRALVGAADEAFIGLAYGHACEGTYGHPVYGGNANAAGWASIDYEGDRQPRGYSAHQLSHPEEG